MKCISWNCRELGNPKTIWELHFLVKQKSPDMLFLIETRSLRERIEKIRNNIGFDRSFTVNAKGSSGRLAMTWNLAIDIEVHTYTRYHIFVKVNDSKLGKVWTVTGFYGHSITAKREGSWQLLMCL